MRPQSPEEPALVIAAQAGDRRALDTLLDAYLPFVYTIVRRALDGEADVDDVVQESMVRVIRDLGSLRDPETFRSWLGTITVRQISTHLQRRRSFEPRNGDLFELTEVPDAVASFEGMTLLRLDVAAQRLQAARAARWLDSEDRVLLSLWWLEIAGRLTRTELAAAAGVSIAHAGVRVQRMRQRFEQCRALLAALDAQPRCAELDKLVTGWDGAPTSSLRKRLARHVHSCASCDPAADELVAAEKLLIGFALLTVPVTLTAAVIGRGAVAAMTSSMTLAGAAKAGLFGHLVKTIAAHQVTAVFVTGTVAVGAAVAVTTWPAAAPPALPAVVASPSRAAAAAPSLAARPPSPGRTPGPAQSSPSASSAVPLTIGSISLEAGDGPGLFVTTADGLGVLAPRSSANGLSAREQTTFEVVAGLADPRCVSLRALDGGYLRHSSWRLRLSPDDGTKLFRGDATFCAAAAARSGSVLLESWNYPGWFVHRRAAEVWVDHSDGSAAFLRDSTFWIRSPLAT
jgi:RNA polymerase sigma factor (sigma-70 family)